MSEKISKPSNDPESIFKHISNQVKNNINSKVNLKSYIQEKYKRDKPKIVENMEILQKSFSLKLNTLIAEGETSLNLSKVNLNRLLFNFSSPETILKIKFHNSLKNELNAKPLLGATKKI